MNPTFLVFATLAVFCCFAFDEKPCGTNEAKYPCGKRCEATCNAGIPSFCRGLRCLGFACRCKNGYARDPVTGECVKIKDCPKNECALLGESLGPCGRTCEGTCKNPFQSKNCQLILCQGVSCRCDLGAGYVRDEISGTCVRTADCPQTLSVIE